MKTNTTRYCSRRTGSSRRAMTLIEIIGVMVVLVILAAILVPALLRKMDQVAGDQESATLKALGDALQSSILRHRYIPGTNNWAQVVAVERGVNLSDVTTNLRRQPRVFLVDPALQIGSRVAGQDYTQDNLGSVIVDGSGRVLPPISPRIILLSSIGQPLPVGVTTGVPATTNDFNGIWNAVDGALPAGGLWAGWTGARDLKIQRVNLSSLFVHVVLTSYASYDSSSNVVEGKYSIDGSALTNAYDTIANPYGRDSYFLQNSRLNLYSYTNSLDTQQILTRDISFVYQQLVWRASIEGLGFAGGMDIGTIVDRFLRANANPRAEYPDQQRRIVDAMMAYMEAYQIWEGVGFGNNAQRTAALNAQDVMMDLVQGLYKNPDNDPPEVACPP